MKRKLLILAVAIASIFAFCSCSSDNSDEIDDLKARVSALEEWQVSINSEISDLQRIINDLQNQNWITSVTQITVDGVTGYRISFKNGDPIVIMNGKNGSDGKDGSTPEIGVKKDSDGIYYWTLNGEFIKDDSGSNLPVSGKDAIAPQVRINPLTKFWEISNDGGKTWENTGVDASGSSGSGESFFKNVVTTDPTKVTFVLKDGTIFSVPIASDESVSFEDGGDTFTVSPSNNKITVIYTGLDNWKAAYAQLLLEDGSIIRSIQTRASDDIVLTAPASGKSTVTINKFYDDGTKAILKVTCVDSNNVEISASRGIVFNAAGEVVVNSISLDKTSLQLKVDDADTLIATVDPSDAAVSWTSSDPSVATVDSTGIVTAMAVGNATITATAGTKTATCAVTVERPKMALEYVAEYNVGTVAGTFATSQSYDESGYYTWAEAMTDGTVPSGYHVPESSEWWAIAPDVGGSVKFSSDVNKEDYTERIVLHGKIKYYKADYYGVSSDKIVYGLRYKSSDNKMLSAWRYEYISDGSNTRMVVTERYLGSAFTGDISTIANESYWNTNNSEDVKRTFPAAGYYNASNVMSVKGVRGYFWASNEKGTNVNNAFCMYFRPEQVMVSNYDKQWKVSIRPFSDD